MKSDRETMTRGMNGQRLGDYSGSTGGKIVININERESSYHGVAYLIPTDSQALLGTAAPFTTANHLEIPDEFGAFFNLVQHPGYPTPLLDWTYSQRAEAAEDLSTMGVTAGSLFPGIDGAYQELKERNFAS